MNEYRAYDPLNKVFKYYTLKELAGEDKFGFDTDYEAIQSGFDNWKWDLWTGQKDKRGVKIYANDIIDAPHCGRQTIVFGEPYNAAFCVGNVLLGVIDSSDIMVVGNIYAN